MCQKRFATSSLRNLHIEKIHHTTFSCDKCSTLDFTSFPTLTDLVTHHSELHNIIYEPCNICGLLAKNPIELSKHTFDVHGNDQLVLSDSEEELKFCCHLCPRTFAGRSYLTVHLSKMHKSAVRPSFECDKCDQSYFTESGLKAHEQWHLRTIVCPECDKGFSRKNHLHRHLVTVHTKDPDGKPRKKAKYKIVDGKKVYEKTYVPCPICGRQCDDRILKNHLRTHSDERPFLCDKCDRRFKVVDEMKRHIKAVHDNMKPFCCSTCGNFFKRRRNLIEHEERHKPVQSYPHKCSVNGCGKAFKVRWSLASHLKRHKGVKDHQCPHCEKQFTRKLNMKLHISKVHKYRDGDKANQDPFLDKNYSATINESVHSNDISLGVTSNDVSNFHNHNIAQNSIQSHLITGELGSQQIAMGSAMLAANNNIEAHGMPPNFIGQNARTLLDFGMHYLSL